MQAKKAFFAPLANVTLFLRARRKFFGGNPVTVKELRTKRLAANIPGHLVCQVAAIGRTRLSDIECEYVVASAEELGRINEAIDQILRTRKDLAGLAAKAGLSLVGFRL